MLKKLGLSALLLTVAATTGAQAHMIWLERDGAAARAYFGEWAEDLRETEDTHLKRIPTPQAVTRGGGAPVVTRAPDHFALAAVPAGDVRVRTGGVNDKSSYTLFQAKVGREDTTGLMALELVPQTAGGSVFTLLLNGQPLPKTQVTVFGPPKWSKELRSDDAGRVTIPTPWPGQYVVEASHVEKQDGALDGKPYNQIRHVATLTFTTAP
ncbi:DUF4198 domain-containing protein [Azospirillum sp.]|uniref:DUF4198 domain-containing protein n=1 Tax=Azospirillum sp. TaxID=34012 RepID=UPI0026386EC6|nr:DUF4198 domain-containing protein [Azospirillum sp.]